jgi:uncharacterized protein (TIGR02594 family)
MNPRVLHPDDPAHLHAAFSKLGLSEIEGPKHEKQVLAMYRAAGHPEISDDETAWCAAFVGWCLKEAGLPNTGSLMARSYVKYGVPVGGKKVPRGAIVVWPRGAPPSGHVNICLDDDGTYLTCIGGNQGNGRGGGVTITKESKSRAITARMPPGISAPLPKPKPEPKPAPTPDAEEPPIPVPLPPDVEPVPPAEPKIGFLRRIRNWVVGATSGISGLSFLAYLTDWQVVAILCVAVFIFLVLAVSFFLWLFGKQRVRDWFTRILN